MHNNDRTNVMRILDAKKVVYTPYYFPTDSVIPTGIEAAKMLNLDQNKVFKTLVTQGKSGKYYVFDIPVAKELNLKKAATSVNEKNISMIKSKELFGLTGYVHGGCSPIGLKKALITTFDSSLNNNDKVIFSGGKIGTFVEINVNDLKKVIAYKTADIAVEKVEEENYTW